MQGSPCHHQYAWKNSQKPTTSRQGGEATALQAWQAVPSYKPQGQPCFTEVPGGGRREGVPPGGQDAPEAWILRNQSEEEAPAGHAGPHLGTASLASLLHPPIAFLGRLFSLVLSQLLRILVFDENCMILESNAYLKFKSVPAAAFLSFP